MCQTQETQSVSLKSLLHLCPAPPRTQCDAAPESLQLKDSCEEQRLSSGMSWTSWNCVRNWLCVLFSERIWILYQISSGPCDQKKEESLTGARFSILYLLPSPGPSLLFDSLKFPSSHHRSPRAFHLLPSLHCWPFWISSFTPQLLGLPSYFADVAFLKMICAYSSNGQSPVFTLHRLSSL